MPQHHASSHTTGSAARPSRRNLLRLVLSASLITSLVPGLALAAGEAPVVIGGVSFERTLQLGGQSLVLNGAGARAVLLFKAYAAGLYLRQPAKTAEGVMLQTGAKRLRIHMLLEVSSQEFVKAFYLGVERNFGPEEQKGLYDRGQKFVAILQSFGTLAKGDEVLMDQLPGVGMVVSYNGKTTGAPIIGDDFYAGLLKVFVGDHVADERLRTSLLGG